MAAYRAYWEHPEQQEELLRVGGVVMGKGLVAHQQGFSLIEATVAISIIAIAGLAMLWVVGTTARTSVRAEESVALGQHLRAQIEAIQQSPFKENPADYPAISGVPEGFTVTWAAADPGTSYTYPQPLGTTLTAVVQEITVTATGDYSEMSMTFYKIRMP